MELLIKRGADIEKKTSRRQETPLFYACDFNDADAVEILVKNGANMNDLSYASQESALHAACGKHNFDIVQVLINYGADINILDDAGNAALRHSPSEGKKILMRELAKLKMEEKFICKDNLEYLKKSKKNLQYLEKCLEQLKKLKDCKVYGDISLYDILQMQKKPEELIALLKNENFVAAFNAARKKMFKSIKLYNDDLEDIIEKNLKKVKNSQ